MLHMLGDSVCFKLHGVAKNKHVDVRIELVLDVAPCVKKALGEGVNCFLPPQILAGQKNFLSRIFFTVQTLEAGRGI